MTECKNPSWKE